MTPQQIEALKLALEALKNNKRTHLYCEDIWYSCPKHEDGCANEAEGDECNCGADDVNTQFDQAITALEEALAQPEQEPVVHDPLPRACNLAGVDYQTFLKIKAYMPVAPPQPERHELQAKGEHPAPCARHCEANAFQIVIKNLKAQLAQPEQEEKLPPVEIGVDVTDIGTTVVAFYRRPNAVMEMFYSQFHPLAQPEQEPVAWLWELTGEVTTDPDRADGMWLPLYTTPPQRKPLTQDGTMEIANQTAGQYWMDEAHIQRFRAAVEAAHGIKENT